MNTSTVELKEDHTISRMKELGSQIESKLYQIDSLLVKSPPVEQSQLVRSGLAQVKKQPSAEEAKQKQREESA